VSNPDDARRPLLTLTSVVVSIGGPPRRTGVPHQRGNALRLPPHPDAPDPGDHDAVRRWVAELPRPRAVDLFCGAGGLSLGLRDAGFSVVVGADSNAWAVETHTTNLGGLGYVGDLSEPEELLEHLAGWGIDHVELVAGGVPCQPFSRAGQAKIRELIRSGHRNPADPRAFLWRSFMVVVERLKPDAVLVENVPDLPTCLNLLGRLYAQERSPFRRRTRCSTRRYGTVHGSTDWVRLRLGSDL
jgi:hypothetical protein